MSRLTFRPKPWALGLYLAFIAVLMPLLSIRRVLGLGEPGEIRNWLLPGFVGVIVMAFGIAKVLKPRTWLQLLIAVTLCQALIVGIFNSNHTEDPRNFLSHLFQLASAYLMISAGWSSTEKKFGRKFWRNWSYLSLLAIGASTVLTVGALGRGDVGRLYTPAYGLLLVTAYATLYWKRGTVASYLLSIVSNKRAVILGMISQTVYAWVKEALARKGGRYVLRTAVKALGAMTILVVMTVGVVDWAASRSSADNAAARAVNITVDRLRPLLNVTSGDFDVKKVSSGRLDEVISALHSAKWWYWIIGAGAGWSTDLDDGRERHNIHVSPLSLSLTFGAPFAILLYGSLTLVVVRMLRVAIADDDPTSRMAPIYIIGALVHSLFAYSLFIDLLTFFFVGAAMKSLADNRRRTKRHG